MVYLRELFSQKKHGDIPISTNLAAANAGGVNVNRQNVAVSTTYASSIKDGMLF